MRGRVELDEIAKRIKQARRVVIFSHMRPDGDAVGSSLALACALDKLGVECEVCNESLMPSNLSFLKGLKRIKKSFNGEADLFVALDSADEMRLGTLSDTFAFAKRKTDTINVDHHVSNTGYAKYNYIRACAANCMNVASLLDLLGVEIDKEMATYLLVGLLTDSGNFSHDDVDEECFLLAARLVKAGADIRELTYNLFKKQSKARAALHAEAMSKMRYYLEDRFAVIVIPKASMEKFGADVGMTEGFVDFPLNVETVEVAASLMEVKKGQYKVSLRSKLYADVNGIAGTYGGGGHIRAAGCMLFGDIEEILDKLRYTVSQYL